MKRMTFDSYHHHQCSYADIGMHAFGRGGRIIAQFSVYTTLFGVSIIFLILLGILMSSIIPEISRGANRSPI